MNEATQYLNEFINKNVIQPKIFVCASCLKASCLSGEDECDNAIRNDYVKKTIKELKALGKESERFWKWQLDLLRLCL